MSRKAPSETTAFDSSPRESRGSLVDNLAASSLSSTKPGDTITYGAYPQTADGTDRTPVNWRVLQNSGSDLFVLSEYILDCKRYHREYEDITWRDCALRNWLNEEFYGAAFSTGERVLIKTTQCTDNGEGSPDTEDKVFVLSAAEVKSLSEMLGKDIRRAVGTEYSRAAKEDGCRLYVYDKSISANYITINGRQQGCSWWWLRTRLSTASRAAFVGTRASIRSYGRVSLPYYGVRPALWLSLTG